MIEIEVTSPEVKAAVMLHNLTDLTLVHTNMVAGQCICAQVPDVEDTMGIQRYVAAREDRPQSSGDSCYKCGGITIRTGTCTTCTTCGESGGCG